MLTRYGEWLVRWRWPVLLLSIALIVLMASGARLLGFTSDYRAFFSDENPQLLAFEELQEAYTRSDNILIMLEPAGGDVFVPEVLGAVLDLTERAWQVPWSVRVDSLTNYQHMRADGDDLIVEDLLYDVADLGEADLQTLREVAFDQPALVSKLLATNGATTGVNITLELPADGSGDDPALALADAMHHTRAMIEAMRASYPDIVFRTTGVVPLNQAFPEASFSDMQTIIPIAFGVIIVGILVLIGSPVAMLATVLVVLMSIVSAMGMAGWLGIRLTPPSAAAPTLILTLAVADCVHFLVTLFQNIRDGSARRDAVIESLRINFSPIFLTSVTTAIGFLSMNFSDAPPFHDLGNITAMGVLVAFVLSVTFLPALMAILPFTAKVREQRGSRLMRQFSNWVVRRRSPLLWGMGAVMIGVSVFLPRNELNDVFVKYFNESIPFRAETDDITDKLSGIYLVDYSVDSGEEGGVSDPGFLAELERFERYLQAQPEVQHVSVITETMRRLNRSMHGDDQAYYHLPQSRELSAQYLLLYEMSLPYGLDLNNQINFDKSTTRVSATLETLSTQQALAFEQRVLAWMQQNTPSIATLGSGPTLMFSHIAMRNIQSMLTGTTVALVLISLILVVALRSVRFGLISLIPNIMPALMAFGLWGLIVGEVGLAVSVVVAMTLGIVVDDTIHFLSKYLRARRERGLATADAVRYAFSTVGVALVVTTIVLVCGFLVIAQSNFLVNAQMGLLTAITITFALIVDFLFLPPLLMALDRDRSEAVPDATLPGAVQGAAH